MYQFIQIKITQKNAIKICESLIIQKKFHIYQFYSFSVGNAFCVQLLLFKGRNIIKLLLIENSFKFLNKRNNHSTNLNN